MTTDLLDLDADAPELWEPVAEDEDDIYRCGCADCRALRGRGRGSKGTERDDA